MTRAVTGTMCAYWIREFEFESNSDCDFNSDFHFTTSTSRDSHFDSVSDSPIPIPTRSACLPYPIPPPFPSNVQSSFRRTRSDFDTRRVTQFPSEQRGGIPPSRGKKGLSGAQEVHRLGASGEKSKTNDETKQNERIINMENVDSCRRRKWWSNFRSTTLCAT